ncbi:MAG: metallophosphoesterase, partial [Halioglobus sp.]
FDHGNVHVVSLDSQLSARDAGQRATMRSWLIDDLSSNTSDWTVVIFHHPPYSKGANHDSDTTDTRGDIDLPQLLMREEFVELFDEYGVDLVYSGHSHSYERSYYLRGHTESSDMFTPAAHAELVDGDPARPASGREGEAYAQLSPTSGGVDDRVVYTVAGNGGKADETAGRLTAADVWLLHPAHIEQPADTETPSRRGLPIIGSVIVDAGASELAASFIDVNGNVLDRFTITR